VNEPVNVNISYRPMYWRTLGWS